ncbi:MAG: DHHA1 domain-containing protein, partial [Clostridia bacterium]|nr:DHHA1 domain-containing protein [Clostridia bacterium]
AKQRIAERGATKNIIMLYDENWRTGFVGIVAARLVEEYSRPVIIFAGLDGDLKGSARSVDGVNIFETIASAKDLLTEFGGHAQAAGVAIKKENFYKLEERLDEYLASRYDKDVFIPKINAECEIDKPFPMKFARELELLEPYGVGNKKPLFVTTVKDVSAKPLKPNSPHVSFKTPVIEMLKFGGVDEIETLEAPVEKKIVFEINLSTFQRQLYLKGYVKDVLPCVKGENIPLISFEKSLDGILLEESETDGLSIQEINNKILTKSNRYSTAYIVNDERSLEYYPALKDCQKGIFKPTEKNLLDIVLFAPTSAEVLSGFERVIYLDEPFSVLPHDESQTVIVATDEPFPLSLEHVDVSRSAMADAFVKIKALAGRKYTSSVRLYTDNKPDVDPYQFIFALAVFGELEIFTFDDGILKCDAGVKRDLMTSKIYKTVLGIKERC